MVLYIFDIVLCAIFWYIFVKKITKRDYSNMFELNHC